MSFKTKYFKIYWYSYTTYISNYFKYLSVTTSENF
jgi:hypothetical protein